MYYPFPINLTIAEQAEIKKKISELEDEVSGLKIERKKRGILEAKELSIIRHIIALVNKATALENKATALTNEKVELLKAAAGIVHDHLKLT